VAGRRSNQPPPRIAERLRTCRERIQQKSGGGYLLTNRADQLYLTGFGGEDGAVLILPRSLILVTDGRFKQEAAALPWAKAVFRSTSLAETVGRVVRRHRIQRLGFQPEAMSVALSDSIRRAIKPSRVIKMPPIVAKQRLLKDSSEVATITKAVRIAESAFRTAVKNIRPGMTEKQVAARLLYEMLSRGADEASFPSIVAVGPNAAKPHAVPGDRKIRSGSAVLIDWGARINGYCSDLTRVIFVRRIPPRFKKMYESVLAAQRAAIEVIRPGARMADVDDAARSLLTKAKMGRYFSHGLGHGLGLEVHEGPRLGPKQMQRLAPGMVVTVEPGVYVAGLGGVRIEDDVLVTPDGCRVLSCLSKDIDDMIV
jgi:Xaa-Pro aminopeptidase